MNEEEYENKGILIKNLTIDVPHQIKITPQDCPEPGWGSAFGYYYDDNTEANTAANKAKLISIDASLTTMAFAPKKNETNTAAQMFSAMFWECTNLTTPATFKDTYKLPNTISDLSSFLAGIHYQNTSLRIPINLTPLSGWFRDNKSVDDLSEFLAGTHFNNTSLKLESRAIFPN